MNLEVGNRRHVRGTVDFFVNRIRLTVNDSRSLTNFLIPEEASQFATGARLTNFFIMDEVSQFNDGRVVSVLAIFGGLSSD